MEKNPNIVEGILRNRFSQLIINDMYKKGKFRIPIHLALGHESIAVAVSSAMSKEDQLILPHRNIHYNLACGASLKTIIDEFLLKENGLGGGGLGSMNLMNEAGGIPYTSSILGNNLAVSSGVSLANRILDCNAVTIVVTGDGAMEEGAFYESLVFMASQNLPTLVVVENNGWSLASRIEERRCSIKLADVARGCGAGYELLQGNDSYEYCERLQKLREKALQAQGPVIVEVSLETLGSWRMEAEEYPQGKYINYHAGPAPTIELSEWPLLEESECDPFFVLSQNFEKQKLYLIASNVLRSLEKELK